MKASAVILLVRENMNDLETGDYRVEDSEMLRALDEAQLELVNDRPDLLLDTDGTIQTVTTVSATTTDLLVDENYRQALASAVCSKLYTKDSDDDFNLNAAGIHKQIYDSET
jgi:hypothetical protein